MLACGFAATPESIGLPARITISFMVLNLLPLLMNRDLIAGGARQGTFDPSYQTPLQREGQTSFAVPVLNIDLSGFT